MNSDWLNFTKIISLSTLVNLIWSHWAHKKKHENKQTNKKQTNKQTNEKMKEERALKYVSVCIAC